jgi:hypothetical protein
MRSLVWTRLTGRQGLSDFKFVTRRPNVLTGFLCEGSSRVIKPHMQRQPY